MKAFTAPAAETDDRVVEFPLRECAVLASLIRGASEKEIAWELKLSTHTVHEYTKSLHKRLDVHSRGELIAKVFQLCQCEPDSETRAKLTAFRLRTLLGNMGRPRKEIPTDGELKILAVLWSAGPSTVRDVQDALLPAERPSMSAVTATLLTMVRKKFVVVVDERRPQKFAAVPSRDSVFVSIMEDVRRRVFAGSLVDLMKYALRRTPKSKAEVAELRKLVSELGPGDTKSK